MLNSRPSKKPLGTLHYFSRKGKNRMFLIIMLCAFMLFSVSCSDSDNSASKGTQKDQVKMFYSVKDNEVVVHNTPWGDQRYTMELPPGALGGTASIYVGEKNEPRIEIVFHRDRGVLAVTVDGEKVPSN